MLNEEQSLERAMESGTSHIAMLKFDGSGHFDKDDLALISAEFEEQFDYPLPVTARGQTTTHQSLGFDHRGKVDVGLNPQDPEGIWLRHFLEEHQIPYIAFRSAARGRRQRRISTWALAACDCAHSSPIGALRIK